MKMKHLVGLAALCALLVPALVIAEKPADQGQPAAKEQKAEKKHKMCADCETFRSQMKADKEAFEASIKDKKGKEKKAAKQEFHKQQKAKKEEFRKAHKCDCGKKGKKGEEKQADEKKEEPKK